MLNSRHRDVTLQLYRWKSCKWYYGLIAVVGSNNESTRLLIFIDNSNLTVQGLNWVFLNWSDFLSWVLLSSAILTRLVLMIGRMLCLKCYLLYLNAMGNLSYHHTFWYSKHIWLHYPCCTCQKLFGRRCSNCFALYYQENQF